jgi:hypothetical protein
MILLLLKRQRDGFGAFRKETGCHPAPPQALYIMMQQIITRGDVSVSVSVVILASVFRRHDN